MQKVLLSAAIMLSLFLTSEVQSQNSTDHFRSFKTGNWDHRDTWESSIDGVTWSAASAYPTQLSNTITIQPTHEVTQFNASYSADQITVMANAKLNITRDFIINDGPGDDLIVYGAVNLFTQNILHQYGTIVIKDGGRYIADITKRNKIYPCTWETGSTLELINFGSITSIDGLSQSFYNLLWKGLTQTVDISLNLTDGFQINNDFIVESTNGKNIILTSDESPITWHINGNLELKNKSYMILSSGTGPVSLTIGGNLNIGSAYTVNARLEIGSVSNAGNFVNLNGDLNINANGGININSTTLSTLCFINTSNVQHIQIASGVINNINYILNPGVALSSNSLNVDNGFTLKLKENASLITNSLVIASIEQTVANADWTESMDGWHLLSSPVGGQSVAVGGFTWPANDPQYNAYDFYSWSEPQNQWLNQKVPENDITSFVPGTGYLVAYDDGGTKTFTGTLNKASIPMSNLPLTGTSVYGGYHLLGNPFPCALDWYHAGWLRNNVSNVASVWNESAKNYLPITDVNPIIPSNQGFFVQVSAPINSMVIPEAARVHNSTAFNKHASPLIETPDVLYLRVTSLTDSTFDETMIRIQQDALPGYDLNDGHKLSGSDRSPQLYTEISSNENASVNSFPATDPPETVPLFFRPGDSDSYELEVLMNSMDENVFLEDLVTGVITPLNDSTRLTFESGPQDPLRRFLLHLGPVGLSEVKREPFSLYSYGRNIYIRRTASDLNADEVMEYRVLSITGRMMAQGQISIADSAGAPAVISVPDAPPGIYLISLTGATSMGANKEIVLF